VAHFIKAKYHSRIAEKSQWIRSLFTLATKDTLESATKTASKIACVNGLLRKPLAFETVLPKRRVTFFFLQISMTPLQVSDCAN